MKTVGSTTTFEHVTHYRTDKPTLDLIIVLFDGEPELWQVCTTVKKALQELREYYLRDWRGTGRVIPCRVYRFDHQSDKVQNTIISCG